MAGPDSLEALDERIAIARDNLRELTEQAAAYSGGEDEARAAERIADQQETLDALLKARAELERAGRG